MCGQEGLFGTSAFNVVLDTDMISKIKAETIEFVDAQKNIEQAFAGLNVVGDPCSVSNLTIASNIHNITGEQAGDDDDYNMDF